MTADHVKQAVLGAVSKYDRGIYSEDDFAEYLTSLARLVDDEDRERVSVSSHDD